jgi:hypothetical protein
LPSAQLAGQPEASSSGEASGRKDPNFITVPESNIITDQRLIERDVFIAAARWQAADKPVRPRGNCEAGAKMLVVTRPGIVRLRIETIFKPRDQSPIQMIVFLYRLSLRVKKSSFTGWDYDAAGNRLCSACKLFLISRYPVGCHLTVCVCCKYHFRVALPHFESAASFIHEQAAHIPVVRMCFAEVPLNDMKFEGGIEALKLFRDLPRSIKSIVDEENDFISLVIKRISAGCLLLG